MAAWVEDMIDQLVSTTISPFSTKDGPKAKEVNNSVFSPAVLDCFVLIK